MRNAVIFCLLFVVFVFAQIRESVAVLPSVGELDPQRLELLTDKVREIASKTLPQKNFMLLKLDAIIKRIGEEELYRSCKEGVCIGELARKASSDYGARCDIFKIDNSPVLKFELYDVKEEAIVETFTDYDVKDFQGMLMALEARLPDAFKKMVAASKNRELVSIIPRPLPQPAPILPLPIVPAAEPQTTPAAKPAQDTVVNHVQETEAPEPKKGLWMSQGWGAAFGNNFGGEIALKRFYKWHYIQGSNTRVDTISVFTYKKKLYHQGWGISAFTELTYIGVAADAIFGNGTWDLEEIQLSKDSIAKFEKDIFMAFVSFGVFGKYPIAVSEKMTWFPVAGIYYGLDDATIESNGDELSFTSDALLFKFGA